MRKIFFSILVALAPLSAAVAAQTFEVRSELEEVRLSFAKEFRLKSQATERNYRIQIAVVGDEPEDGYPVLFVLDGDAYFSGVASMANAMARSRAQVDNLSLLIVGVGYSADEPIDVEQRSLDYTPPLRSNASAEERAKFGQADRFYHFLQSELISYLTEQYRIDSKHLALFGHSFGALYVLYDLLQEDSLFNYFILSSPSIWWHNKRIQDFESDRQLASIKHVRITVGELEGVVASDDARRASRNMMGNAELLFQQLKDGGDAVEFMVYPGESHGSVAYKSVLDSLKFLQTKLP